MSSGLPLKADIAQYSRHVSNVPPTTAIASAIVDHLVGARERCAIRGVEGQPFIVPAKG